MMEAARFAWHQPVHIRFGAGCLDEVGAALGARPVIVLAFAPARALGHQRRLGGAWGDRLAAWIDVPEGLATLALARELAAALWPIAAPTPDAVLLGLGGGSTLDLAKLLRCRPRDGGFEDLVRALRGQAAWPALDPMPLWLAPTTAGTGSEVTRWATLWDTDGEAALKRSLDEPFGYAERAFVDPTLSASCPAALTRDCALDAFAHALEAMWNRHANPISDALALSAARRIVAALPVALDEPQRAWARADLALAALEAGLAFAQTRTALAHALSYALTLEQGLPHGLACAVWLPTAWRLAVGREPRVDALLEQVFGVEAARGEFELRAWLQELGVEGEPSDWGVADAPARVQAALTSVRGRNFIGAQALCS
jgi:alcohol dehydrogenase